ncbi:MAG: BON domain-containing protein [Deltaproteobacteria bacterium]|jgi:hyperosmotically inducible protein
MAINDEDIKVAVIDQLYWDSRVEASKINVTVEGGEVVLSGSVPSLRARQAAYDDARNVSGVIAVENRMVVEHPETPPVPPDERIQSNVQDVLNWNVTLDARTISVSVKDGVVTLEGTVDSYWEKVSADETVSHVRGVVDVVNKLSVVPAKKLTDEKIAQDIKAALERNVAVNADSLGIAVANGVVTLSGTVRNWGEHTAAFFTALYTKGVVNVDDRLSVKGI